MCCRLNSFRASAICFAVASRGNTVKIIFDLESAVSDLDAVADVSLVAGISGGLLVFMRPPYWFSLGGDQ